jgi:hypothetical protein
MSILFRKLFHLLTFLLTVGVFSYSTFLSFFGVTAILQTLRWLPRFSFDSKLMLLYGAGYLGLAVFYLGLILYLKKKPIFLSKIFTLTTEKGLFNLFATVLVICIAMVSAKVQPQIFLLVDSHLNPFKFSIDRLGPILTSFIGYFCVFYPFASTLVELVKSQKFQVAHFIALIALAIFFNPIFIDFGLAFLALSTHRVQFEATHRICGVQVVQVTPNGPAAKAGLYPEEIIQKVNDHPVTTADDFVELIQSADTQAGVSVVTDKSTYQITPIQDPETHKKIIGITMESLYCPI